MTKALNLHSASEQALGYIYQARFALFKLLQMQESVSILIEKDDDLEFVDQNGKKSLGSLKHKAVGGHLNDLSSDFWRSVRIWLLSYIQNGKAESTLCFFLFTTETVSNSSFLQYFLPLPPSLPDSILLSSITEDVLSKSISKLITPIRDTFQTFNTAEKEDFLSRIIIFDNSPRITDIPTLIQEQHMRSIRYEHRQAIFERLEGWWNDTIINLLSKMRTAEVSGYEVSDKLFTLSEEYKLDNLPIQFRGKMPAESIDVANDPRLFVVQLRELGIASSRIQSAILDYYRAFEQRSAWARENLLLTKEMESYEDRIIDEWERYKDVLFENLDENSAEMTFLEAGKALYKWASLESIN